VQPDIQGNYTVLLGDTTGEGIPLELFSSDEPRWFGIQPLIPGARTAQAAAGQRSLCEEGCRRGHTRRQTAICLSAGRCSGRGR